MENKGYRICKRCIMDTSDMDITFDDNGNCNHCNDVLSRKNMNTYRKRDSEQVLDKIINKIKENGKNKKYDCLIGVSGGVDSAYTIYLALMKGLRPLVWHMNNGWNSEIAENNIKNLVERMNVDYVNYVLDWEEFKEVQLAFLRSSTVDFEIPTDIGILASQYQLAKKYGIKYILSGGNSSSESIRPLTWGYHSKRDMVYYKHIVKIYGAVKLKKTPTASVWDDFHYKIIKNIKTIYFLDYFDYDKDKAKQFLKDNFQWEDYGGKHHESKITAFWQGYVMPVKFNMDYRRATYSSQICFGQISREEALKELEKPSFNKSLIAENKKYIAERMGISIGEMESYLALPPKTYKDFPNNKKFIDFVFYVYFNIYKRLKKLITRNPL